MKTMQTKHPAQADKMEKVLIAGAGALCCATWGLGWPGVIIGAVGGFLLALGGERAEKKANRDG